VLAAEHLLRDQSRRRAGGDGDMESAKASRETINPTKPTLEMMSVA
jgi:hypothetical protein